MRIVGLRICGSGLMVHDLSKTVFMRKNKKLWSGDDEVQALYVYSLY
jgi:hypothetical protein